MEPTLTKHIGKLPKMDQLIQSKIEDNLKQQKSNININNFDGIGSSLINSNYRKNSVGNTKHLNEKLSTSSSNLNKKIQEVYQALNGIGDRNKFSLEENEHSSVENSLLGEEIELNKLKRNLL